MTYNKSEVLNKLDKTFEKYYNENIEELKKKIKYVDTTVEKLDKENYAYAYCYCGLPLNYVMQVPRPEVDSYIRFKCLKCGKELGLAIKAKRKP